MFSLLQKKMGRTNAKLEPFLRYYLESALFLNLLYEDKVAGIFQIKLPRYDKEKCGPYEGVLKAWYDFNGKLDKYVSYSNAKSVLQAALKKSVYLITLPSIGNTLRFRFATPEEVKEKKRLLKEQERAKRDQQHVSPSNVSSGYQPASPSNVSSGYKPVSPSNPPSVSSDYHSGSEESEGECLPTSQLLMPDALLTDVLDNPEKYIYDFCNLDEYLNDESNMESSEERTSLLNIHPDIEMKNSEETSFMNIHSDVFLLEQNQNQPTLKPLEGLQQLIKPVTELQTTPVVSRPVKKYWLCTQKMKVKSTLQLICESQIIENEDLAIKEGSVVFPNGVFEPGVSYILKKNFELNEMYYFFFNLSYNSA